MKGLVMFRLFIGQKFRKKIIPILPFTLHLKTPTQGGRRTPFWHSFPHLKKSENPLTPRGAGGGRFGPPPSSFLQITRKKLKLTPPETSWLFLNISCPEFQQKKISKILSDPPFKALFESVKKWPEKKVVGSINVFNKSCRKFYILGSDFFFFLTKFQKWGF